jgi:hypothetical protein
LPLLCRDPATGLRSVSGLEARGPVAIRSAAPARDRRGHLLIIDEIQHVLAGPLLKQRQFLNVIKLNTKPPNGSTPGVPRPTAAKRASILSHIVTSIIYTVVSLAILGDHLSAGDHRHRHPDLPTSSRRFDDRAKRQADRLGDHRSVVHETDVLPGASVGSRQERLRSDVHRRHEFGANELEAHRRHQSHDRRAQKGQPGCSG